MPSMLLCMLAQSVLFGLEDYAAPTLWHHQNVFDLEPIQFSFFVLFFTQAMIDISLNFAQKISFRNTENQHS